MENVIPTYLTGGKGTPPAREQLFRDAVQGPKIDMTKIRDLAYQGTLQDLSFNNGFCDFSLGIPESGNLRSLYWKV